MELYSIKRGTRIEFSEMQMLWIKALAELKLKKKIELGLSISSFSQRMNPLERETQGIAGEFVACRLLGLPDPTADNIANINEVDLTLPNNLTVDIKTSAVKNPSLFISKYIVEKKKILPDYYFLIAQHNHKDYTFNGCLTKDELINEKNLGRLGSNPSEVYKVRWHGLKDFKINKE